MDGTCARCKKYTKKSYCIGDTVFCRRCYENIWGEALNKERYTNREEFEGDRLKVLRGLDDANCSNQAAINDINDRFARKIREGLIIEADGHEEQSIILYEDRMVIITDEKVDKEYLRSTYFEMLANEMVGVK